MNQKAELLLRGAVEWILEQHDDQFVLSDTIDGFMVHLLNRPVVYCFSFDETKGWLMDALAEDFIEEASLLHLTEEEQLSIVVDQYNVQYILYKRKPKNRLAQQRKTIDTFFSHYQELLRERSLTDNRMCYTFHPIDGLHPRVILEYNQRGACWTLHHTDFNKGKKVVPPLKDIYCQSQRLVFELNKQNV